MDALAAGETAIEVEHELRRRRARVRLDTEVDEQPVVPQCVVVVQILVAQGEPVDGLAHETRHRVRDARQDRDSPEITRRIVRRSFSTNALQHSRQPFFTTLVTNPG